MLYNPEWEQQTKTETAADILRRARALIEREENWSPVGWGSSQMCGLHALRSVLADHYYSQVGDDLQDLLHRVAGENFASYNDTHTHAEVLAKFDEAIAMAERIYARRRGAAKRRLSAVTRSQLTRALSQE